MKDFLKSVFPNYTDEMYDGKEPCGIGHEHKKGGFTDRWECKCGVGESYNGELICATVSLNRKEHLFIYDETLYIYDVRYKGKLDVWEWCSDGKITYNRNSQLVHPLEKENIEKIIFPKCECSFCKMVYKRANELYKKYFKVY